MGTRYSKSRRTIIGQRRMNLTTVDNTLEYRVKQALWSSPVKVYTKEEIEQYNNNRVATNAKSNQGGS